MEEVSYFTTMPSWEYDKWLQYGVVPSAVKGVSHWELVETHGNNYVIRCHALKDDYQKRYEEQARMQDGGQAPIEADPHWAPCTICGDNVEAAYIFEDVCVCLDHTLAEIIGARIKVRLYR